LAGLVPSSKQWMPHRWL